MDTDRSSVGISPAEHSVPLEASKRDADATGTIVPEEDLKLEHIPDNLEHADFSKLLELDEKNDDDLFHGIDILDQQMKSDQGKEDIELRVEEPKREMKEDESSNVRNEDKQKLEAPESPKSMPAIHNDEKSVKQVYPLVKHEENTPAAIIQERLAHNLQRHNSLTPMMFPLKQLNELKSDMQNLKLKTEDGAKNSPQSDQNTSQKNAESPENGQQITQLHPQLLQAADVNTPASNTVPGASDEQSKISAYARLDFQDFTFYVQTLQVIIGRRSENDYSHKVDVNLGPSKSISRRHAQIFYNFGTGRFELSIMGKNGAFVDDNFVERGSTVPLKNKTKIQIGQIPFQFVLPDHEGNISKELASKSKNSTANASQPPKKKNKTEKEVKEVKEKKAPKPPKPPKKVYTLQEIPPEYRTKPTCSYSNLITSCLRKFSTEKGMSLSEIYSGIRELFPYYKYCPDGWQSSVRHNLSLNKSFCKVSKEGKGWLWGLDEEYIAERERQKKKQAEAQAAKAKVAELKQQQQQEQRLKKQQQQSSNSKQPNMAQTLAANRSDKKTTSMDDNQRTMKYLQEQLMILTKDRKGLDKSLMAQILTQALAMTINQVTQAAKQKGISGNPLTALIDKNPQHLNLILAAAVNAATAKVTKGKVNQLVNMPPPTVKAQQPSAKKEIPIKRAVTPKPPTPSVVNPVHANSSNKDQSFDPTSLSKFFQPKQQQGSRPSSGMAKTPTPPVTVGTPKSGVVSNGSSVPATSPQATSTVVPKKRPASDTESSDSDDSNSSDSDEQNKNGDSSGESSGDSSSSSDSDGDSGSESETDGSDSDSNSDDSDNNGHDNDDGQSD